MRINENRLIDLLQAKRREDPDGFSKYLPGAADLLPEQLPRRGKTEFSFGLTEQERNFHEKGLSETLANPEGHKMNSEEAVAGLRHCAALIRDDNLSDEVDYDALTSLVKAATGKSPGAYKANTVIPIGDGGPVLERISAIRGVYLELDREQRLVSVSIYPGRFRERHKLMAIVGVGKDDKADVASRHDDYLAMQEPHGDA